MGPLGRAKFRVNRFMGVGMWPPKKVENFTFSANSRPATANPLADFYIFKGFYTSNYPVFQI